MLYAFHVIENKEFQHEPIKLNQDHIQFYHNKTLSEVVSGPLCFLYVLIYLNSHLFFPRRQHKQNVTLHLCKDLTK